MFGKKKPVIVEYKGSEAKARQLYQRDAEKKAKKGYYPVSENYTPGKWGVGAFVLALLLCVIVIGILVFIYMVIVPPAGTLTVTYEYKEVEQEIKCPQCAETIKAAAKVCRFCGFQLQNA